MARSVSSMPPTCWQRVGPESSSVRRRGRPSSSDRASVMTSSTSRRARGPGSMSSSGAAGEVRYSSSPGAMCWFDVVVPADDPRFQSVAGDVGASMRWLGRHVATALGGLGVGDAGGLRRADGRWTLGRPGAASLGSGPAEVLVDGPQARGHQPAKDRATARGSSAWCTRRGRRMSSSICSRDRGLRLAELPSVAVVTAEVADGLPESVARVLTSAHGLTARAVQARLAVEVRRPPILLTRPPSRPPVGGGRGGGWWREVG